MIRQFGLLGLVLALSACGGDTLSGILEDKVEYTLSPTSGPSCQGTDDTSRYTSGTYASVRCKWYCATYKGQKQKYVGLHFRKSYSTGQVWVLDSEYISDGIC
jgi:hypothetical protein